MTLPNFLRVTKSIGYTDADVTKIELGDSVSAGIRWGSLGVDMVPMFEEHLERISRRYTLEQWAALDPIEKAMMIAVRRIENAMKNLQAEAEAKKAKRK